MTIGDRLRKARERKKLSQIEVSKRTNINNKTLSRYEKDKSEPDFATLEMLADLYEVQVGYFFGEVDKTEEVNLKELFDGKKLMWGNEELSEEEKERALDILQILLTKKDTD